MCWVEVGGGSSIKASRPQRAAVVVSTKDKSRKAREGACAFGAAIKELRESRGIIQKEVVKRLANRRYASTTAYGRIEHGQRRPDRETAICILADGLLITDSKRIDSLLAKLGYEQLSESEILAYHLTTPAASDESADEHTGEPARPSVPTPSEVAESIEPLSAWDWASLALAGVLVVAGVVSVLILGGLPKWFVLLTAGLYSTLYPVSILLETACATKPIRTFRLLAITFGFMFATSVLALLVTAQFTGEGDSTGFWVALSLVLAAGVVQWLVVRPALPSEPVVKTLFPSHTAQAAHLKNTLYFLAAATLFWLPAANSVASLNQELRLGHQKLVAQIMREESWVGSLWHPKPTWLWIELLTVILISLPMGFALIGTLRPQTGRNRFTNLFYTRALLYFTLCFVCVVWYSLSLDEIKLILPHTG